MDKAQAQQMYDALAADMNQARSKINVHRIAIQNEHARVASMLKLMEGLAELFGIETVDAEPVAEAPATPSAIPPAMRGRKAVLAILEASAGRWMKSREVHERMIQRGWRPANTEITGTRVALARLSNDPKSGVERRGSETSYEYRVTAAAQTHFLAEPGEGLPRLREVGGS